MDLLAKDSEDSAMERARMIADIKGKLDLQELGASELVFTSARMAYHFFQNLSMINVLIGIFSITHPIHCCCCCSRRGVDYCFKLAAEICLGNADGDSGYFKIRLTPAKNRNVRTQIFFLFHLFLLPREMKVPDTGDLLSSINLDAALYKEPA